MEEKEREEEDEEKVLGLSVSKWVVVERDTNENEWM